MPIQIPKPVHFWSSHRSSTGERGRYIARSGSAITEYALIGSSVAVVCIAALFLLGSTLSGIFNNMLNPGQLQSSHNPVVNAPAAHLTNHLFTDLNPPPAYNSAPPDLIAGRGELPQTSGGNGRQDLYAPQKNPTDTIPQTQPRGGKTNLGGDTTVRADVTP